MCPPGYTSILVETFYSGESTHRDSIQVRPLTGQPFSSKLLVECRRDIRYAFAVGTVFRLCVTPKQKLDGRIHLYCPYRWSYDVVTEVNH
jgi:hypothetical protein